MRILLVNPPTTHIVGGRTSSFIDSFIKDNALPPLGLMYLGAFVEKTTEHEVHICDMNVNKNDITWALLKWKLESFNPQVVGITTTTMTLYDALLVAEYCKRFDSNIVTVLGGGHCSIYPQETASFSEVDYVAQGEGELPFLRVLRGIAGKVAEVEIIEDLDTLPFPARHLVDLNKYHSVLSKKKVTSMITSRGCPLNCTFCYQPHYGKRWRARSAKSVVDEMEAIVKMGIGEIEIMDDTFTFDYQRVIDICLDIIKRDLKVDWNIRTRVDKVDEYMLQCMQLAGCKRINYGVESFCNQTLKTLKKGFDMVQAYTAIHITKKVGIEVQAYLMLGSPGETFEQMKETANGVKETNPDYAYYSLTCPMPGTPMYEQGLKEGKYEDYWRKFALNPSKDFEMRIWNENARNAMVKVMEQAYRSFYFRPSYVLGQIGRVKSFQELVNKARMAIGMAK